MGLDHSSPCLILVCFLVFGSLYDVSVWWWRKLEKEREECGGVCLRGREMGFIGDGKKEGRHEEEK